MPANRIVHKWTKKDREYLVLLKLKYTRKLIAPLFNHLLARTLSREGFRKGLSAPALDVQYQEVKVGGKGHEIYADIIGMSESRVEIKYHDHLRDIKAGARALNLRLESRKTITNRSKKNQTSRAREARMIRAYRTQRSDTTEALATFTTSRRATELRHKQFADTVSPFFANTSPVQNATMTSISSLHSDDNDVVSPTTSITYDFLGNPAQKRPLLLFRCTENPSAFRARRFLDLKAHVPRPEPFGSKEYREWAIHHLERCDVYPSPFLSFAQNPRNAIRRIETARSENFDKKRFLVVFAFNHMEANAAKHFGPGAGPHLARMLFDGVISDLPDGYTGAGEWLIHGFVDCKPLLVLDAAQVVKLARAVRKFKTGIVAALTDVRECLQNVHLKWQPAIAYAILRSYCGRKLPPIDSPAYTQMMQTIVNGTTTSTIELQDFARLSVTDGDPDYEQEDEEEDSNNMVTPSQRLPSSQQTNRVPHSPDSPAQVHLPVLVPSNSVFAPSSKTTTVQYLNSFNARLSAAKRPEQVPESTSLWSPDQSEAPTPSQNVLDPLSAPTTTLREQDVIETNEEDKDWDFVNDDLEDFFTKSFPSAAKRAEKLYAQPAPFVKFVNGLEDEEEEEEEEEVGEDEQDDADDGFIVPSIETDRSYNFLPSYSRGNLLRGLTAHAASESPPPETPSKVPYQIAAAQALSHPRTTSDRPLKSTLSNQRLPAKRSSKSTTFQTIKAGTTSRVQPLSFKPPRPLIDLTSVDTSQVRGTIANPKTSAKRIERIKSDPKPSTTVRTKVPVIVRKTIVDYSV